MTRHVTRYQGLWGISPHPNYFVLMVISWCQWPLLIYGCAFIVPSSVTLIPDIQLPFTSLNASHLVKTMPLSPGDSASWSGRSKVDVQVPRTRSGCWACRDRSVKCDGELAWCCVFLRLAILHVYPTRLTMTTCRGKTAMPWMFETGSVMSIRRPSQMDRGLCRPWNLSRKTTSAGYLVLVPIKPPGISPFLSVSGCKTSAPQDPDLLHKYTEQRHPLSSRDSPLPT